MDSVILSAGAILILLNMTIDNALTGGDSSFVEVHTVWYVLGRVADIFVSHLVFWCRGR